MVGCQYPLTPFLDLLTECQLSTCGKRNLEILQSIRVPHLLNYRKKVNVTRGKRYRSDTVNSNTVIPLGSKLTSK